MKIVKITLISIAGLIVLVLIAAAIFIKTLNVNKYLPQITRQIGQSINRQVSIDHVDLNLSLIKGLLLDLDNLIIKDDSRFSQNDFLVIKKVHLGLDIMPLLFKRQIHVTSVVITSVQVKIIRSQEGRINAQTMVPEPPKAAQTTSPAPAAVSSASSTNPTSAAMPEVSVKSILIEQGEVSFEDKNEQLPLHVVISDISATIDNFSLTQKFSFAVHLNAWGKNQRNIDINGQCILDLSKNAAHISDLKINSDLSRWDWTKVRTVTSMLEKIPVWPQEVKGNLLIDIPQLNASASGLEKLSLEATLNGGYISLKELLNPIKDISFQMNSDLNELTLKELKAKIENGEFNAQGHIHGLLTAQTYDFELNAKSINIEDLLNESAWPVGVKGGITGQFSGSGGSFEPDAMLKNLKGNGSFNLVNAKIEKLNILQAILDKLNFIPGLSNQIQTALPSAIKDKLDTDTTVLDKVEGKAKLENEIISIDNADIESKLFSINAQGTVGFNLATNVALKTYLASDLSSALIKSVKPFKGLLDDQKRIYIPGRITGKVPSVAYIPDVDYISKKALSAEGSEQINKQLDKVLDKNPEVRGILNSVLGGGQQANTTATNSENTSGDQNQGDSTKKLINNVLNKFLH